MIPASHFIWVIQAEREEQMRRSKLLVTARSASHARSSVATRLMAVLGTRRADDATCAGRPSPAATCPAVCC